ncbi:MAG TPA: hypothetical protein VK453_10115 [Micromonosporaceae bacterium]|nr:hypothetical protein [Micromonosporaceae bacterium]
MPGARSMRKPQAAAFPTDTAAPGRPIITPISELLASSPPSEPPSLTPIFPSMGASPPPPERYSAPPAERYSAPPAERYSPPPAEQYGLPRAGQYRPPTSEQYTASPAPEYGRATRPRSAPPAGSDDWSGRSASGYPSGPVAGRFTASPADGYVAPPDAGYSAPHANGYTTTPTTNSYSAPAAAGYPTAPTNGYAAPPATGYSTSTSNGYAAAPGNSYATPAGAGYPTPPTNGYTTPPSNGYTTPPGNGYTAPPTGNGYGAPPDSGPSTSGRAAGYATPPASGYATPPGDAYAAPATGYATPPATGYATPPATGRATPPATGRATPPATGYATPPATGYAALPATGYATPPATGRATPAAPGYAAPETSGYFDESGATHRPGPAERGPAEDTGYRSAAYPESPQQRSTYRDNDYTTTRPRSHGREDDAARSEDYEAAQRGGTRTAPRAPAMDPEGQPAFGPSGAPRSPAGPNPYAPTSQPAPRRGQTRAAQPRDSGTGSSQGRMATYVAIGVVLVVLITAVSVWYFTRNRGEAAPTPDVGASTEVPGRDLSSRDVDPDPLTEAEVFPAEAITLAGNDAPYAVLKKQTSDDCRTAAADELGTLLTDSGCSQVVRATLKHPTGQYLITTGLFNLADQISADQAHEGIKPAVDAQKGRFTVMPAGAGTEAIVRAPTQLGWNVRGHFLAYCVIARANGEAFTADDPLPKQIIADLIETYLGDQVIGARAAASATDTVPPDNVPPGGQVEPDPSPPPG